MKYIILGMGTTIIVLLMLLLVILIKKSKKAKSSEDSCNQNNKSHEYYNQNQDYKTEALGVNNKESYKESNINFGEIPVLSQSVRIEALSAMDINSNKNKNATEILGEGNKSYQNIGTTELLQTPERVHVYAVLQYKENGYEKEFNITGNIVNIGRDPEVCELIIPTDNFLGRNHAMIYMKDKKFFIIDLNSKNGTFVNGQRIQGGMQIEDGIPFKIASTEMKIKCCV